MAHIFAASASGKRSDESINSKLQKEITLKLITEHNIPNKSSMSGDDILLNLQTCFGYGRGHGIVDFRDGELEKETGYNTTSAETLGKLSHIRLDRLQISKIENLECLGPVTNLYLQQNCIQCLENLEALTNLRFLALAGNRIRKIQNLKALKQLKFLDLSFNCIENCDADQLPLCLFVLSLKGNPCTSNEGYRNNVTQTLPNLKELDEIPVNRLKHTNDDRGSSDEDSVGFDDENDKEIIDDFEEDRSLKAFSEDIISRMNIRSTKEKERHDERMAELQVSG